MSTFGLSGPTPDPPRSSGDLQFERADFGSPSAGLTCSQCQGTAAPEYHELAGKVFCTTCRQRIEASIEKLRSSGSMGRAFVYGLGAAVLGSVAFYAVSALTGYQFGLIAVVVGWAVGKAVRKGSGSFGGRRFQVLAVLLTYASITSTHIPGITKYFFAQAKARAAATASNAPPGVGAGVSQHTTKGTTIAAVKFFGVVFLLSLALPILSATRNILGLIIIGIALWEAWKFTREVKVAFSGPFTVSQSSSASSA